MNSVLTGSENRLSAQPEVSRGFSYQDLLCNALRAATSSAGPGAVLWFLVEETAQSRRRHAPGSGADFHT